MKQAFRKSSKAVLVGGLMLALLLMTIPLWVMSADTDNTKVIADFEGDTAVKVEYPTDESAAGKAQISGDAAYDGSKSLKIELGLENQWTTDTYQIGGDTLFAEGMTQKYLSFWMDSRLEKATHIAFQLMDTDWSGDVFYLVEIQPGVHLYNVDISDYGFKGTRGIKLLNWGDYSNKSSLFSPTTGWEFERADNNLGIGYIDSIVLTDTPRTLPAVPKTVTVADFEGDTAVKVEYPTDESAAGKAQISGDAAYDGSKSLKIELGLENQWTTDTYQIGGDTLFAEGMTQKYLSFWMDSRLEKATHIAFQLMDTDWSGDVFYLVEIQPGVHLYNVDISDYGFKGTRGIKLLNWGDYSNKSSLFSPTTGWEFERADNNLGIGYIDSIVLTDTPRTLPDEPATTTTTGSGETTTTTAPIGGKVHVFSDFDTTSILPKTSQYMVQGKDFDIVGSPSYEGNSLKMVYELYDASSRKQFVLEGSSFYQIAESDRYLSFWMHSEQDYTLRVCLLDPDWAEDWYTTVQIQKGTHFYNVDFRKLGYDKSSTRGVMFMLDAEDYLDENEDLVGNLNGISYVDSVVFCSEERALADNDEPVVPAGAAGVAIPLVIVAAAGASVLVLGRKNRRG